MQQLHAVVTVKPCAASHLAKNISVDWSFWALQRITSSQGDLLCMCAYIDHVTATPLFHTSMKLTD